MTSRVGTWLGITFGLCFVTGLLSHGVQHDWLWPTRPVDLYRVTQGVHVISGVASIPLLLAKLWSVYPKLFERPLVRNVPHALERGSIFVLIAASFFELVTGLFNAAQNYPWSFYFPTAHYAVAWIVIGALLVHIAVKIPLIRRTLEPKSDREDHPVPPGFPAHDRADHGCRDRRDGRRHGAVAAQDLRAGVAIGRRTPGQPHRASRQDRGAAGLAAHGHARGTAAPTRWRSFRPCRR